MMTAQLGYFHQMRRHKKKRREQEECHNDPSSSSSQDACQVGTKKYNRGKQHWRQGRIGGPAGVR
jgi:hypothetical protein